MVVPVAFVVLTAAYLLLSGFFFYQTARFGALTQVARKLEGNERVSDRLLQATVADADAVVSENICRSDVVRAGLTVMLNFLSRQQKAARPTTDLQWPQELARGRAYLKHAIACMPTNGNLWLRLAVIEIASGASAQTVVALMQQSAAFAPYEIDTVAARIEVWNTLAPVALTLGAYTVDGDLRTLLQVGRPEMVAMSLKETSTALLPYLKAAGKILPEAQRQKLVAAGLSEQWLR